MYTSESSKLRSIETQLADQQKQSWAMLVVGITLGFVGLHFLMARPMAREMERMQRDLTLVEQRMQDLVGARDEVWETNSLLSSLKAQQGQTEEARVALQSIRELRGNLVDEASHNIEATKSLELAARLQSRLIEQRPVIEAAGNALEQMQAVENRLVAQRETNESAAKTLDEMVAIKNTVRTQAEDVELAKGTLDQMVAIGQELRGQNGGLAQAASGLKGLATLKAGLTNAAENLEVAQSVSDQLIALELRLADGGQQADVATERAAGLITLSNQLNGNDLNLVASQQNLDGMLKLQKTLAGQSKSVIDAVQSLELLGGFHDEFVTQVQVLGEMRRTLLEISLMETTISRVSRMMKPLVELGNLRHLSDDELRQAARLILDGRTATRVSKNSTESRPQPINTASGGSSSESGLVPLPADEE
ncbi:MAG: hypothetical protein AABP62_07435 [Planctomycetota bacterium]